MLITHAVYERAGDACARIHDPHFILARVVPRRESLGERNSQQSIQRAKNKGKKTHDHGIKRNEDASLGPVGLTVSRDIVHEEARADEERYFE